LSLSLLGLANPAGAVELRVGAFIPATGAQADVGVQMKGGIEVAIEQLQARKMMVGGEPLTIKVIFYDDEAKADVALNAVTRAITVDKIHAAMGFLSSDVFVRVMEDFQKAGVPVIACCAGSNKIGDIVAEKKLTYVFQLSPTVNDIAGATTAATIQSLAPTKVAFLNENTDAGRDESAVSRRWMAANAKNVEIAADEFVPRGTTDLTVQFAKLKRAGVQAIIGEIYGSSAPVLVRQWYEAKVPALLAHHGASVSAQSFIDQYKEMVEGMIINNRWWPAKYTDLSEPMIEAYTKKVGSSPTNFSVPAYDALIVFAEAAQTAGTDPEKLRGMLENTTFKTAWGMRKFTPLAEGHRMPIQTVVVQIQDGKKVPIYPETVAKQAGGTFRKPPPYAWEKK
jgi:branched-chain amino acid transport system substrate-binding protein